MHSVVVERVADLVHHLSNPETDLDRLLADVGGSPSARARHHTF
jgi:hypothetical protein